jgi:hypothetical protein
MRTFIPNPGFIKELEVEDKAVDAFVSAAEAVADNANDLRNTFYREEGAVLVRNESSRVHMNVYVINVDAGGHMDEWGSVNNEANAPLRRGVENAGLEFQPLPK